MNIRIPAAIAAQFDPLAKKARCAFKKKIKDVTYLGYVPIKRRGEPDRNVGIFAKDISPDGNAKTIAAFAHDHDIIWLYRSVLKRKPPAIQHYLAHEMAHALDLKRVKKNHVAATTLDFGYASLPIEFEAEMAAIENVDIPYLLRRKRSLSQCLSYLRETSDYIGFWLKDASLKAKFERRVVTLYQSGKRKLRQTGR